MSATETPRTQVASMASEQLEFIATRMLKEWLSVWMEFTRAELPCDPGCNRNLAVAILVGHRQVKKQKIATAICRNLNLRCSGIVTSCCFRPSGQLESLHLPSHFQQSQLIMELNTGTLRGSWHCTTVLEPTLFPQIDDKIIPRPHFLQRHYA